MEQKINVVASTLDREMKIDGRISICKALVMCASNNQCIFVLICVETKRDIVHVIGYDIKSAGLIRIPIKYSLQIIELLEIVSYRGIRDIRIDAGRTKNVIQSMIENTNSYGTVYIENVRFHLCDNSDHNDSTCAVNILPLDYRLETASLYMSSYPVFVGYVTDKNTYKDHFASRNYRDKIVASMQQDDMIDITVEGAVIFEIENVTSDVFAIYSPDIEKLLISDIGKSEFHVFNQVSILEFLLADQEIFNVQIQSLGRKRALTSYLVVAAVKRSYGIGDNFSIADINFHGEIELAPDTKSKIIDGLKDDHLLVWTTVDSDSHYRAYKLGHEKILFAVEILNYAIRNDSYNAMYGIVERRTAWDYRRAEVTLELFENVYIENLTTGENVLKTRYEIDMKLDSVDILKSSDCMPDWIQHSYDVAHSGNNLVQRLLYSIKWLNKSIMSDDSVEALIFSITAMEFCVSGEDGDSIYDDELTGYTTKPEVYDEQKRAICLDITNRIASEASFIPDDVRENIVAKCKAAVRKIFEEPCFRSRFERLLIRLNIPHSDEEIELVKRARYLRNRTIHGSEMERLNNDDIKRIIGIASRVVAYKLKEALGGIDDGCD